MGEEIQELEKERPPERGYVWGRIWCILVFIGAIASLVIGIMLLSASGADHAYNITLGILLLIAAIIYAVDGYGMWVKKSWALVLTYALLAISFVSGIIQLLSLFGAELNTPYFAGWLIGLLVRLIIDVLWFCYFYKRRAEFN